LDSRDPLSGDNSAFGSPRLGSPQLAGLESNFDRARRSRAIHAPRAEQRERERETELNEIPRRIKVSRSADSSLRRISSVLAPSDDARSAINPRYDAVARRRRSRVSVVRCLVAPEKRR